jgi:hypothetical protein
MSVALRLRLSRARLDRSMLFPQRQLEPAVAARLAPPSRYLLPCYFTFFTVFLTHRCVLFKVRTQNLGAKNALRILLDRYEARGQAGSPIKQILRFERRPQIGAGGKVPSKASELEKVSLGCSDTRGEESHVYPGKHNSTCWLPISASLRCSPPWAFRYHRGERDAERWMWQLIIEEIYMIQGARSSFHCKYGCGRNVSCERWTLQWTGMG